MIGPEVKSVLIVDERVVSVNLSPVLFSPIPFGDQSNSLLVHSRARTGRGCYPLHFTEKRICRSIVGTDKARFPNPSVLSNCIFHYFTAVQTADQ